MAKFSYGEHLTTAEAIVSAKLGTSQAKLTDADVGKPVKMTADSTYGLCSDGDQIEGFVRSVEPFTVEGTSFGGVQIAQFKTVTVDGAIAIGDYVVAAASGKVKKAPAMTADGTTHPKFLWRYVSGEVGAGAGTRTGVVQRV